MLRTKSVLFLAVAAFSMPLIPAKAGTQGRSEVSSRHPSTAAMARKPAQRSASLALGPGLRREERRTKGYDARAKHAAALRTLGAPVDDPYAEPPIPQIALDTAAAGDTSAAER